MLPPLRPASVRDFVTFEEHVEGVRRSVDGVTGVPEQWYAAPTFYFTNPHAIYGHRDDIPVPPGSAALDFELEVGAVIGREGRNLADRAVGPVLPCADRRVPPPPGGPDGQRRAIGSGPGPHLRARPVLRAPRAGRLRLFDRAHA
jgi:hypothetical protein